MDIKDYIELKLKRKNRAKSNVILPNNPVSEQEDIGLLAMMALMCSPSVTKKVLFSREYAYYIPSEKDDIGIAKEIFKRNNIYVEEHDSNIISYDRQIALRINYKDSYDEYHDRRFFYNIQQKQFSLFGQTSKSERTRLWQKVLELRENQKN